MKHNTNILLLFSMLLFGMTACDSLLDKEPETSRTESVTFNNANDFMLAANYLYSWLPELYTDGVGLIDRDYDADIACEASGTMSAISESSNGTSTTDSRYSNYYAHIRAINELFANKYKIAEKSTINQYLAEAYFFRAYYSFMMFMDYGPLTIIKDVMDTNSPELYAARNSRDEFADFIIQDLTDAIELQALPKEAELRNTSGEGRITIGAAQALLARVCLFEATWQKYHYNNQARANELFQKAVTASKEVMADGSYELFYNSALGYESYRYMFTLETDAQTNPANVKKNANKEYILRKCFNENTAGDYLYTTGADKPYKTVASRKMVEMHLGSNGQPATYDYVTSYTSFLENKDPRLAMNFLAPNSYTWSYANGRVDWQNGSADLAQLKLRAASDLGYPNRKWVTERTVDTSKWGIDIPIIRLAEVYLTYAEAMYELNNAISDADLNISINKLRNRVGMVPLTNSTVPNGSTMLDEIRRERTVELYLEGHRLNDLRRWATAKKEMSTNFEYLYVGTNSAFLKNRTDNGSNAGMPSAESTSEQGYAVKQQAAKRQFKDRNYLLPLPTAQIELNPNIEQNPGWE